MPRPSRLILAKEGILSLFAKMSQKVYSQRQLADVLQENRHSWHLAKPTTVQDFVAFLTKQGDLRARRFRSKAYGQEIIRYAWGNASPYELALRSKHAPIFATPQLSRYMAWLKPPQKRFILTSNKARSRPIPAP